MQSRSSLRGLSMMAQLAYDPARIAEDGLSLVELLLIDM